MKPKFSSKKNRAIQKSADKATKQTKFMDKVKIKRVKRVKKQIGKKEKVLAGFGLGSSLLGGVSAVGQQQKQTQIVGTQQQEQGTSTSKIREKLRNIFGVPEAKANVAAEGDPSSGGSGISNASTDSGLTQQQQSDLQTLQVWNTDNGSKVAYVDGFGNVTVNADGTAVDGNGNPIENQQVINAINNTQAVNTDSASASNPTANYSASANTASTGTESASGGYDEALGYATGSRTGSNSAAANTSAAGTSAASAGTASTNTTPTSENTTPTETPAETFQEGQTRANAQGQIEAYHNGEWTTPQSGDQFTDDSRIKYTNIGSVSGPTWIADAGQEKVSDQDGKVYISDGQGGWTLKVETPATTPNPAPIDPNAPAEGTSRSTEAGIEVYHNGAWGFPHINDIFTDDSGIKHTMFSTAGGAQHWIPLAGQEKVGDDGQTYVSDSNGRWALKTEAAASAPTSYDVWRTEQGVGAYFNSDLGFITVTPAGQVIDQNGNDISSQVTNNADLQAAVNQIQQKNQSNDVQNKDFAPSTTISGEIAGTTQWQNLTPEQQVAFVNQFSNGQNTGSIPNSFSSDSAIAYALSVGGAQPGATVKVGNVTYTLGTDGQWSAPAEQSTPQYTIYLQEGSNENQRIATPAQGVNVTFNRTTGVYMINGLPVTTADLDVQYPGLSNALQSQTVIANPVQVTLQNMGNAVYDPSMNDQLKTLAGQINASNLPQTFSPNSALAYASRQPGATLTSDITVAGVTYKFDGANFVRQAATTPTVLIQNNDGKEVSNTNLLKVGDQVTVKLTGTPGSVVTVSVPGMGTETLGTIGTDGTLTITRTVPSNAVGSWNETYSVGGQIVEKQFSVASANAANPLLNLPNSITTSTTTNGVKVDFTINKSTDGNSIMIQFVDPATKEVVTKVVTNAQQLNDLIMQYSSKGGSSAEAAAVFAGLSNISNNFSSLTAGTILPITGSDITGGGVWSDSSGNRSVYVGSLGGRLYYDSARQLLILDKGDGNPVVLTNNNAYNQTRVSEYTKTLTGAAVTNKTEGDGYAPGYDLLTEVGRVRNVNQILDTGVQATNTITQGKYYSWSDVGLIPAYSASANAFKITWTTNSSTHAPEEITIETKDSKGNTVNRTFYSPQDMMSFLDSTSGAFRQADGSQADAFASLPDDVKAVYTAANAARLYIGNFPSIPTTNQLVSPPSSVSIKLFNNAVGQGVQTDWWTTPGQAQQALDAFKKLYPNATMGDWISGSWQTINNPFNWDFQNDPRRPLTIRYTDSSGQMHEVQASYILSQINSASGQLSQGINLSQHSSVPSNPGAAPVTSYKTSDTIYPQFMNAANYAGYSSALPYAQTASNPGTAGTNTFSSQVQITNITAYDSSGKLAGGVIGPNSKIEIGGMKLQAYSKFKLVIGQKEYDFARAVISENKVTLTVPDLSGQLPAGSVQAQVKIISDVANVAQGVMPMKYMYVIPAKAGDTTSTTGIKQDVGPEYDIEENFSDEDAGAAGGMQAVSSTSSSDRDLIIRLQKENADLRAQLNQAKSQNSGGTVYINNYSSGGSGGGSGGSSAGSGTASSGSGGISAYGSASGIVENQTPGFTPEGLPNTLRPRGLAMPAGYSASSGLRMPENFEANSVQDTSQVKGANVYTVKKGDTLWSIAKKYYGDGTKWRKILEANTKKVKSPKALKAGTELNIPSL